MRPDLPIRHAHQQQAADARTTRFIREMLFSFCKLCDVPEQDTSKILNDECMSIRGQNLVINCTALPGVIDLILDIGTPTSSQREKVYAALLSTSFEQLLPGIFFCLNPQTNQLFAKTTLSDEMGDHAQEMSAYLTTHVLDYVHFIRQTYQFE